MKLRTRMSKLSLFVLLVLVVAACGGTAPAPASDNGSSDAMPAGTSTAMPADAASDMQNDSGTALPADSSGSMQHDPGTAMPVTDSGAMDMEPSMSSPAWFSAELTDVNTGQALTIAGFQGKVVLVETMAIWCPNCLQQQKEVKALHEAVGMSQDLVTVVLDIDPNENAGDLGAYSARNGFDWTYAVAPRKVAREIGQLYGDQFLNPTSTPMLIVDRHGEAHPLPFGIKSASTLQETLDPFLNDGM
jgi:thiol-disulfide isomerase/thioredoxin